MSRTLQYHSNPPGKIFVTSKPLGPKDLQFAYTPGVAEVCQKIMQDPQSARDLVNLNRVLVVSDGTATLGLGNTGPLASKPVMEGKVALMARLGQIDAIDMVCAPENLENLMKSCAMNFGAINLEDVAAPRCFEIVENWDGDIPLFHDDQDGTAIVVSAALTKALSLKGKSIGSIKVVINGAGASAQATASLLLSMGLQPSNLWMFDSNGLLSRGRSMDKYKSRFAFHDESLHIASAMEGADVFIGLSVGNSVSYEFVRGMSRDPIVFALANPIPDMDVVGAGKIRPDGIFATGRSDDVNRVNNVLCFPFFLRGLLDSGLKKITPEMLHVAVKALSEIESEFLLPDPFDWRLLFEIAPSIVKMSGIGVDMYKWHLLYNALGLHGDVHPTVPFPDNLLSDYRSTEDLFSTDASFVVEYSRTSKPYRISPVFLGDVRTRGTEYSVCSQDGRFLSGSPLAAIYHTYKP